jgi:hypothetical protein
MTYGIWYMVDGGWDMVIVEDYKVDNSWRISLKTTNSQIGNLQYSRSHPPSTIYHPPIPYSRRRFTFNYVLPKGLFLFH